MLRGLTYADCISLQEGGVRPPFSKRYNLLMTLNLI